MEKDLPGGIVAQKRMKSKGISGTLEKKKNIQHIVLKPNPPTMSLSHFVIRVMIVL